MRWTTMLVLFAFTSLSALGAAPVASANDCPDGWVGYRDEFPLVGEAGPCCYFGTPKMCYRIVGPIDP